MEPPPRPHNSCVQARTASVVHLHGVCIQMKHIFGVHTCADVLVYECIKLDDCETTTAQRRKCCANLFVHVQVDMHVQYSVCIRCLLLTASRVSCRVCLCEHPTVMHEMCKCVLRVLCVFACGVSRCQCVCVFHILCVRPCRISRNPHVFAVFAVFVYSIHCIESGPIANFGLRSVIFGTRQNNMRQRVDSTSSCLILVDLFSLSYR